LIDLINCVTFLMLWGDRTQSVEPITTIHGSNCDNHLKVIQLPKQSKCSNCLYHHNDDWFAIWTVRQWDDYQKAKSII